MALATATPAEVTPTYDENQLKTDATSNIRNYTEVKVLEQLADLNGVVVAETVIVAHINRPSSRYSLRIVELKDETVLKAIFHEIRVLNKLDLHRTIMGLYLAFRHRQYIGLLQPPFSTLRDRIDMMHRFKKTRGRTPILFRDPVTGKGLAQELSDKRGKTFLQWPGVFNRHAVVYVLKEVIAALDYLNSKDFVHTQICASSVFVDEKCVVKLGNFLHCKRIGSKDWQFNGHPTRLPPEAFQQQQPSEGAVNAMMRIKPNFDTWAIGLFVLEMITGRRMRYTREEMADLARKFIDGTEAPPTLEETDPTTVINGQQIYDVNITAFLSQCFVVNHLQRPDPSQLLRHPFMTRMCDEIDGKKNIAVGPREQIKWNLDRCMRDEMLTVHTNYAQLKEDLLSQICNAVEMVRKQKWCPVFESNLERGIRQGRYVAVEVSLAFMQEEDKDWSQDVLDVSNASSSNNRRNQDPGEQKDHQRCELVFFVDRGWSNDNRRIFISILFARWYERYLISFADLVRIVDELEDILADYMLTSEPRPLSPYKHQARTAAPDSIAFITGLRRTLMDPASTNDPATHRLNNLYVEVALKPELVEKKKFKMERLREGDPVAYPNDIGPLYAAATFYDFNLQRLHLLESVLLGERRVKDWDFEPDQSQAGPEYSQTQLTTLLKLRRMNPNAHVNSEIDWETSNQARSAKIWGDYRRDFMFRFAKYAVPYKIEHNTAMLLYGNQNPIRRAMSLETFPQQQTTVGLDELELHLARTRSKQEEDDVSPIKQHDDVDLRAQAVQQLETGRQQQIKNLEEQLNQLKRERNSSPAPPRSEEIDRGLTRLPKHNKM